MENKEKVLYFGYEVDPPQQKKGPDIEGLTTSW
jgi:hypothetical protein